MDQFAIRLTSCFQTVFPGMTEQEVRSANHASVAAWDSVAAITLLNVIEEEFGIQMDFEQLPELDSFEKILGYVKKEVQVA
jgi:acyl carrier protein